MFCTVLISFALTGWACGTDVDGPIVVTRYGKIQGVYVDKSAVFYGVPYARAPVGSLRSVVIYFLINKGDCTHVSRSPITRVCTEVY